MRTIATIHIVFLAATCSVLAEESGGTAKRYWPSFRGFGAAGIADDGSAPTRWNVESGENVAWKTAIPGLGLSSPVVWGERLFVTTATRDGGAAKLKPGLYGDVEPVNDDSRHEWFVYCLDTGKGDVVWKKIAHAGVPKVKRHPKSSHANSTPATDGEHVVAFFGSEGLYCYDFGGELLWKKDLGILDAGYFRWPSAQWGFGSSPVIRDGKVIVQCDIQKESFLAALDVETGDELWRTARDEVPTWGTPTVSAAGGKTQIVVNGYKHIGGYDFATGREIWRLRGGGDIPVPTPIVGRGLIFITNAHGPMSPIYAIRPTAAGDITPPENRSATEHIAWSTRRGGNYMQTPIIQDELLFCCNDRGILTCYRANTGERLYRQRLGTGGSGFTASPVSAGGHLYFTSEEGEVHVIKPVTEFEPVATNELGEICMATPAATSGTLYFRTRQHILAIQ